MKIRYLGGDYVTHTEEITKYEIGSDDSHGSHSVKVTFPNGDTKIIGYTKTMRYTMDEYHAVFWSMWRGFIYILK